MKAKFLIFVFMFVIAFAMATLYLLFFRLSSVLPVMPMLPLCSRQNQRKGVAIL